MSALAAKEDAKVTKRLAAIAKLSRLLNRNEGGGEEDKSLESDISIRYKELNRERYVEIPIIVFLRFSSQVPSLPSPPILK
jgi:hypothetical protein